MVAGSYGKSTCAALLAWCLMHAGKNPSYFVGEITKGFSVHAKLGGVYIPTPDADLPVSRISRPIRSNRTR